MSEFKIEKGFEIPAVQGRNRSECPYPLLEMDFGDSFFIPNLNGGAHKVRGSVVGWADRVGRLSGQKFKVKTRVIDGGMRVWKVG